MTVLKCTTCTEDVRPEDVSEDYHGGYIRHVCPNCGEDTFRVSAP